MAKYVLKRLLVSAITLFIITFLLFVLMYFLPGSPFNNDQLTASEKQLLMAHYGLNQPFFTRFGVYILNLLHGDFGVSYVIALDQPVNHLIFSRLPVTSRIGLQALIIGALIGLILGVVAALKKNTWVDTSATFFSVIGFSVPSYVFAIFLVYYVAFKLKWCPIQYNSMQPLSSSILPTVSLAMFIVATMARYARSEMIDCMNTEYIVLVKAKGIPQAKVILDHALRNTMVPIITVIAPLLVGLITGSVVVEQIFGVPGLGQLLLTGIQNNDYNVISAVALVYSFLYIFIMLIVDILYGLIDPRIRVAGGRA